MRPPPCVSAAAAWIEAPARSVAAIDAAGGAPGRTVGDASSGHGLGRLDADDRVLLRNAQGHGRNRLGQKGESAEGEKKFLHNGSPIERGREGRFKLAALDVGFARTTNCRRGARKNGEFLACLQSRASGAVETMSEQTCILVLGMGPLATAAARLLFVAGFGVVLQQAEDPKILRRKMSFADAWAGGTACLDGVEARIARREREFLAALRQKSFIPVLTRPIAGAVERWPWDVIVDASRESGAGSDEEFDAPFRIGLGAGPVAGQDCDLVVATEGPDPGAIIRSGPAPAAVSRAELGFRAAGLAVAPHGGRFRAEREIGEIVAKGDLLGHNGETPIVAPRVGRLIGLRRPGAAVGEDEPLAEVALDPHTAFSGVGKAEQAIARAVLLAVQMEINGWAPVELKGYV
jgi:xanthine dehydrogenase accessory factor